MAQFYSRELTYSTPATFKSNTLSTTFYGYRGGLYVINGTLYYSSNNAAVLYGWQQTANVAGDAQMTGNLAIIDAEEIFENSTDCPAYDQLGQRYTDEYASGLYTISASNRLANGMYTFKNASVNPTTTLTVNTSTSFTTAVSSQYGARHYTIGTPALNTNTTVYATNSYFLGVESPANTFNDFVPQTIHTVFHGANSTITHPNRQTSFSEFSFGNTAIAYTYNSHVGAISAGQFYHWVGARPLSSVSVVNNEAYTIPTDKALLTTGVECANLIDQCVFGTTNVDMWYGAQAQSRRVIYNIGSALYQNGTNANEIGKRIFLTRSTGFSFYLFYNAVVGGIQGVDISTQATNRLALKVFNHSLNTYTTLSFLKKGLGGTFIPSQPDLDDDNNYRFYFIQFNGADTASQTISIYRININKQLGTATIGSPYTLTMTSGQQAQIYADQGYNNTHASKYNDPSFRRQTFNKIWYSVDSSNNRRLHLGIYNTNALGVITVPNQFNDPAFAGSMFKIYSWLLDDSTTSATYLGSSNTTDTCPRFIHHVDTDRRVLLLGSSIGGDTFYKLNETTGLYNYQSSLTYNIPRMFKDREGRIAVQRRDDVTAPVGGVFNNYLDILTAEVGQTLTITTSNTEFTYVGNVITSNVQVDVFNYIGDRLQKNVALTIVGPTSTPGITFADDTYTTTITTSNSATTNVGIKVISSISGKIVGVVTDSL